MKRGEVYQAVLEPRSGSEQRGKRPVLVISHDGFNQQPAWRSVIVVPISTSRAQKKRGPTAILLPEGSGGLRLKSVALCHQVTILDRQKLARRLGKLGAEQMSAVEEGVKNALDLS
jgi:mRNA interferase MazF